MADSRSGYEDTEETGLNLFEDRASAAGNFPHSMLGYDRQSVDSYVREMEQKVTELRVQVRESTRELDFVRTETGTTDFTRLGAHAKGLLHAAEAQAAEIVRLGEHEAERIKTEGRRSAAALRESAQKEADDVRLSGLAGLRTLRQEQAEAGRKALEAARNDAALVLADAEARARATLDEATARASALAETARVESERVRQDADRQATATRLEAQQEAATALARAAENARATEEALTAQLATASENRELASKVVADAREEALLTREQAVTLAEELRLEAIREAEDTLAAMRVRAKDQETALEEQVAWRKEQLEREIAALTARRASMLAALGNLQELAAEVDEDSEATQVIPVESE